MSPYSGYLVETFVTLAGVCVLAVVVLWAGRRVGAVRPSGPLELRGVLPLDARRTIYLVKAGETMFVVGVGEGGFAKIGEIPAGDLPDTDPARTSTFAEVFSRILGAKGDPVSVADRATAAPGNAVQSEGAEQAASKESP